MAFSEMTGQKRAINALKSIGRRDDLPHAFLFTGLPGVGKRTAAFNFGKLINCNDPVEDDCCEQCSACRRANSGNYPDFSVIEPTNQYIRIGDVRELIAGMRFQPIEGRKRVVIFDQCHQMTEEAANALLKTLEEPPSYNLIILIAPEPSMLLSTVVSRTCHLRFQPLSEESIVETLVKNQLLDVEKARVFATVAHGSLERALNFLERDFLERLEKLLERLRNIYDLEFTDLFDLAKDWSSEDESLLDDLDLLRLWWRDLIIYRLTGRADLIANTDTFVTLESIFHNMNYVALINIYNIMDSIQQDMQKKSNKLMAVEKLILGLKENIDEKTSRHTVSGRREDI